jgi:small GTP-binding protein
VVVDDVEYRMELQSNVGFGRLTGIADAAARAAHAVAFVFDVTKRHTYLAFEKWREWLSKMRSVDQIESAVPILILGLCPSQLASSSLESSTSSSSGSKGGAGTGLSPPTSPGRRPPGSNDPQLDSPHGGSVGILPLRSVESDEAAQLAEAYGCRYREIVLPPSSTLYLMQDYDHHFVDPFLSLIRMVHKDGRSALTGGGSSASYSASSSSQHASHQPTKSLDLTVVGDSFVGKSAILERLSSAKFLSKYTSTSDPRLIKHRTGVDGTLYQLRLRDTCGWAGVDGLTKEQLQLTHCVLLVFDLTNLQSLNALKSFYEAISAIKQDKKVAYVLVGSKLDLTSDESGSFLSRSVPFDLAKSLAKQWNCPYVEFSSKESDALDLLRVAVRQVRYVFDESSGAALPTSLNGFLNVKSFTSSSKFKRKFVQLNEGKLMWWKDEPHFSPDGSTLSKPQHVVDITNETEISCPTSENGDSTAKWGYSLSVRMGKKVLNLATPTASERDGWMAALIAAVAIHRVANSLLDEFIREATVELKQFMQSPPPAALAVPPLLSDSSKRASRSKE